MLETILVVDTGSSSMRGILFDINGNILFSNQIKYTMRVGADESAVMDASVFADSLTTICKNTAKELCEKNYKLVAVSLDSQRSSVLAVDEHVQPLHPILMWYDKRCASICTGFSPETLQTIYRKSGMHLTPVSSAPKMLWMRRNLPEIYNAAYKLIGIHDYLLYTLTGELVTDASCACRATLMDIETFQWSEELLEIFEIDKEKLVPILHPGSVVGSITEAYSRLTGLPVVPVISGGGDQQCCLLGQDGVEEGVISVNSGSASYLATPVHQVSFDPRMEVNLSAYSKDTPWLLEAANMGSGTVYQWFNRTFYLEGGESQDPAKINAEVTSQPAGADGLICFSDFAGRGCPATDPNARGIFYGVGLQHTRASFARALLEGVCFDIFECIDYMRSMGVRIEKIQSTGGLTNFPAFNQILADISNMTVSVSRDAETSAKGAFYAAADTLGITTAHNTRPIVTVYTPNPANVAVYAAIERKRAALRP